MRDVHVWERDAHPNDDEESTLLVSPLAAEIEAAIRAAAPAACEHLREPQGEKRRPRRAKISRARRRVVEPNEWWIGSPSRRDAAAALARRGDSGANAGARGVAGVHQDGRSTRLERAADRRRTMSASSWAARRAARARRCLDRGLFVTGIDPAEVDPILLEHPRFRHLRKRSKEVRRSEYLGVRWLAADMNLAPTYTLDAVEAIVTHPDVHIRGMVLTLKLADWSQADRLAEYAARVHGWGYRDVRMRQLASGGQEVCLVALRRKELRRLNRKRKVAAKKGFAQRRAGFRTRAAPHRSAPSDALRPPLSKRPLPGRNSRLLSALRRFRPFR